MKLRRLTLELRKSSWFLDLRLVKGMLLEGSKPVFMSFSDTQCLFLDIALLMEILKASLFLHLMTIGANTVH